jgi:RNase P protein component
LVVHVKPAAAAASFAETEKELQKQLRGLIREAS